MGTETVRAEDPNRYANKALMTFGSADRLSVFPQYRFFTPGLLYLFGHFFDQPLIQFMAHINREIVYLHHRFETQIFDGMYTAATDTDWDHVLWAIEEQEWSEFENFMLSITLCDSDDQKTYRIGVQDILIPDPLWYDCNRFSSATPPLQMIQVFGVNGSHECVAMIPRLNPCLRPKVGFFRPQAYMCRFNDEYKRGDLEAAEARMPRVTDLPADLPPVDFRTRSISELSIAQQQEYAEAIAQYKRKFA